MKVSIITPSFNSADTIRSSIESVLYQTFPDIEYIIIDGCSKDNTIPIIKQYENRFKGRLKWISEPDGGIYDAINKGIRKATGDIIGTLNSDDFYFHDDVIERVIYEFVNKKAESTIADIRFVNPSNLEQTVRYYSSKKFNLQRFRFGFMPAHPSFFTYRKYFEKFGYYKTDYNISSDFELLVRFLYVNKLPFTYVPYDMIKMRTGGISTASFRSNILLNKEIIRACRENGIYTNMPMVLLKYLIKAFELINTRN